MPARFPPQLPFIIGNEACERFSFYGMRNVLTVFLVEYLLLDAPLKDRPVAAKDIFHIFVMGVYFFPLLGGWLADRLLGKYRTIFWLSLVYCVGQACLALFVDTKVGFYAGLFLIALGSGGIKPCVSSFVGDQFDGSNKHLARVVFDAFYWIINFGSFFASLLIPLTLRALGPRWAFGIPGVLMLLSTVIFWSGRHRYVNVPPAPPEPHAFSRVAWTALTAARPGKGRPGLALAVLGLVVACGAVALAPTLGIVAALCLALVSLLAFVGLGVHLQLPRARGVHPDEAVDGVAAVLRMLVVFALVTPFWSLFDQKASTWVLQARAMDLPGWFWLKDASQMQSVNPLLVMLIIPFNNLVLYPALKRLGVEPTRLRRMGAGIAISALSWLVVGGFQVSLDGGHHLSILWQVLPYAILTFGEVLVSTTGLEFAYSQAPPAMKGVLMSFWLLAVTVGGLWVLLANAAVKNASVTSRVAAAGVGITAFQMFFFAGFALAAALAFTAYARRYRYADYYRAA